MESDPEYATKVQRLSGVMWQQTQEGPKPNNPALNFELLNDPNGPALSAWLSDNLDVAKQLIAAPPARMGRMLSDIARLLAEPEPKTAEAPEAEEVSTAFKPTKAPKPMTALGGRNSAANKPLADLSLREFEKARGLDSRGW